MIQFSFGTASRWFLWNCVIGFVVSIDQSRGIQFSILEAEGYNFDRSLKQWDLICNLGTFGSAYADDVTFGCDLWAQIQAQNCAVLCDVSDVTSGWDNFRFDRQLDVQCLLRRLVLDNFVDKSCFVAGTSQSDDYSGTWKLVWSELNLVRIWNGPKFGLSD